MTEQRSRERRDWDDMAAVDPYWGVLTRPEGKHGRWDPAAFFATGEHEIEAMLRTAARLGLPVRGDTALDFGCGLGRLTRALASRFSAVHGVDVSPSLIEQARSLNCDLANCEFHISGQQPLGGFADASISLLCSFLVLQHQTRKESIRSYLTEFARVLAADGVAVFQLPSFIPPLHRIQPRPRIYARLRSVGLPARFLYTRLGLNPIRMTSMPRREVAETLRSAGTEIVEALEEPLGAGYRSITYYVTRR